MIQQFSLSSCVSLYLVEVYLLKWHYHQHQFGYTHVTKFIYQPHGIDSTTFERKTALVFIRISYKNCWW